MTKNNKHSLMLIIYNIYYIDIYINTYPYIHNNISRIPKIGYIIYLNNIKLNNKIYFFFRQNFIS